MKNRIWLFSLIILGFVLFFVCGCKEEQPAYLLPVLTTAEIRGITCTQATTGGNITSEGGTAVTERGVCYSTTLTPTTSNNIVAVGTGPNFFVSELTDLTANTTYYVRAYATNNVGTAYGNELRFETDSGPTSVTDASGNVYTTVTIGSQIWMAENLKTTRYRNGDPIPYVAEDSKWEVLTSGAYCDYENKAANNDIYGKLYNWYTIADKRNLCPVGWHVPTDAEWKTLEMYLGMTKIHAYADYWRGTDQASQLKKTSGWQLGGNGNNTSGFSALPGGRRLYNGRFYSIGIDGFWWTYAKDGDRTFDWQRGLSSFNHGIFRSSTRTNEGNSVRCLQDE